MTKGHHASAAGLGSDLRAERHYSIHGDSTDVNIVPRTSPDPQVQRSVTDRSDYLKALAPADKMTVSAGLIDVMAASDNHEEAVRLAAALLARQLVDSSIAPSLSTCSASRNLCCWRCATPIAACALPQPAVSLPSLERNSAIAAAVGRRCLTNLNSCARPASLPTPSARRLVCRFCRKTVR
jgi:hypothetical protein